MADYSAKMAYGPYSQINNKIQNGTLDERDIVFTSDTSEVFYINDNKLVQAMQSKIWLFDDINSAVNTLNNRTASYEGQPIGIRNSEGNYELYTTWLHGGTYSVKRLAYATEAEAIDDELNEHVIDTMSHITNAERTAWNNKVDNESYHSHVNNNDIHTSLNEREEYQSHVNNSNIHITASEKSDFNTHINTPSIHVTQDDKDKWNSQGVLYTSKSEFVSDLINHDLNASTHVVFTSESINEITGGKITSPVFGLMCHTASARFDLTLFADGYLLYMVRVDDNGNVNKVSRATLSTIS